MIYNIFNKYKYVSIEGNIGAGKTSLTKMICKKFKIKGLFENYITNPYLKSFYKNPRKYSYDVETYFLNERIKSLQDSIEKSDKDEAVVSDYSIFKSLIFSKQNLNSTDFNKYVLEYDKGLSLINNPNLIIYLDASPAFLLDRIKKRGRDFEKNISEIYLKNIEQGYKSFFLKKHTFKVLFYDISEKDFINNDVDLNHLLEKVYNL
tara:strand:- start:309 stop:926 length:618 start_codon:yes stop_codon:yes gene_type:complete